MITQKQALQALTKLKKKDVVLQGEYALGEENEMQVCFNGQLVKFLHPEWDEDQLTDLCLQVKFDQEIAPRKLKNALNDLHAAYVQEATYKRNPKFREFIKQAKLAVRTYLR